MSLLIKVTLTLAREHRARVYKNVSEILQLVEIKDPLIAPGLCYFHGMMEYWNTGIMC